MDTVTHREMRNNSAELLRRVEAGESVLISNHGRTAAVIMPVTRSPLDDLIERGEARPAVRPVESLREIRRSRSRLRSEEIVQDMRGRW